MGRVLKGLEMNRLENKPCLWSLRVMTTTTSGISLEDCIPRTLGFPPTFLSIGSFCGNTVSENF